MCLVVLQLLKTWILTTGNFLNQWKDFRLSDGGLIFVQVGLLHTMKVNNIVCIHGPNLQTCNVTNTLDRGNTDSNQDTEHSSLSNCHAALLKLGNELDGFCKTPAVSSNLFGQKTDLLFLWQPPKHQGVQTNVLTATGRWVHCVWQAAEIGPRTNEKN